MFTMKQQSLARPALCPLTLGNWMLYVVADLHRYRTRMGPWRLFQVGDAFYLVLEVLLMNLFPSLQACRSFTASFRRSFNRTDQLDHRDSKDC
jgi:hypothetical protein